MSWNERLASRALITAIVVVTTIVYASWTRSNASSDTSDVTRKLQTWGLHAAVPHWIALAEEQEDSYSELKSDRILGKGRGRKIRVRRIYEVTDEQASRFMARWRAQIESVYAEKPSPYFAVVTKGIVCPEEFQPVYRQEITGDGRQLRVSLYTNDRLTLGACSRGLAKYRGELLFQFCKNTGALFHIEYYIPVESINRQDREMLESVGCRSGNSR